MNTILKLKNGDVKFVVHGVFGEGGSSVLNSGEYRPSKAMKKRIEEAGGTEMMRMFNTPGECEAYKQGIEDMDGWMGYDYTTFEQHDKIYGWMGARRTDKVPSSVTFDAATLVLITKYHMEANAARSTGATDDIDTLIAIAIAFEKSFGSINWEDHHTPWDDAVAIFYNANIPGNWDKVQMA
jgi:hypothetical protein